MPLKDISGKRFGRLIVLSVAGKKPTRWLCLCDCGKKSITTYDSLAFGYTNSCGCLRKEVASARGKANLGKSGHGGGRQKSATGNTKLRAYGSWVHMRLRCRSPKDIKFKDYGGRGITVCDRWLNSFTAFFDDMGERPTRRHSIDRINNDGNYEPGNCRWATPKQQAKNKRPRREKQIHD